MRLIQDYVQNEKNRQAHKPKPGQDVKMRKPEANKLPKLRDVQDAISKLEPVLTAADAEFRKAKNQLRDYEHFQAVRFLETSGIPKEDWQFVPAVISDTVSDQEWQRLDSNVKAARRQFNPLQQRMTALKALEKQLTK